MFDPIDYMHVNLTDIPPWWVLSRAELSAHLGVTVHRLARAAMEGEGPPVVQRDAVVRAGHKRFYQVVHFRAWLTAQEPEDLDTAWLEQNTGLGETHETAKRLTRQWYDQNLRQTNPGFCRHYRQPRIRCELRHTLELREAPKAF